MNDNISTLTTNLNNLNLTQLHTELNNLPTKEAQTTWAQERSDSTLRYWRG